MKKSYKYTLIFILFTLIFIIGYIRESIFLVINSVLYKYDFPYNRAYISPPDFLFTLSENELVNLKWLFTVGFSLSFLILTLLLIKLFFQEKRYLKIVVLIYAVIFGCSAIVYFIGLLIDNFEFTYPVARFLMGLIQYPLLPMILFAFIYLIDKNKLYG